MRDFVPFFTSYFGSSGSFYGEFTYTNPYKLWLVCLEASLPSLNQYRRVVLQER